MRKIDRLIRLLLLAALLASCSPTDPGNWEGIPVPPQSIPEPSQWVKEQYEGATIKSSYFKSTFRIEENLKFYKEAAFDKTEDGIWKNLKSTPNDQYWGINMTIQEPGMVGRPKDPKKPGRAVVMIQHGNFMDIYLYRSYAPGEEVPGS